MKYKFGILGILISMLAIGVAAFQDELRPGTKSTNKERGTEQQELKSRVFKSGVSFVASRAGLRTGTLETKQEAAVPGNTIDYIRLSYMGLGLIALLFAVISLLKKEGWRMAGTAGALAIAAISWHYILWWLGIVIIVLVLTNLDGL